jgi:DNA-binding MarR family transcriptional regulator
MSSIMNKQVDTVNQSSSPAEDDVLEVMHAVMHQVRARHHRASEDDHQLVGPLERKALGFFARHPGATQSDLAIHSGRDKGQLARLIAGLKMRGLLSAAPDEKDRRVIRLYLTESARGLHTEIQNQQRQLSALAVAGLTADQKQQLLDLLSHIQRNLQQSGQ